MNKYQFLANFLKTFGHQNELDYLNKLARVSDNFYHKLSDEIFNEFLTSNISAYYDPTTDPLIGVVRQVTCIQFSDKFSIDNLNLKIVPDEICIGIVRPLSNDLLFSYGLTLSQIKRIRNDYPFCFFWEDNKSGDAFEVSKSSAGMDLYPTISQFSKMELILPRIINLSWFQVLLKADPTIKTSYNHEITHLINSMRGSKLPEEELSDEEYFNSSEEIQANYIEISNQMMDLLKLQDSYLINILMTNNYNVFIEYIFKKYGNRIGLGIISKNTENKYRMRFSKLFLDLKENLS